MMLINPRTRGRKCINVNNLQFHRTPATRNNNNGILMRPSGNPLHVTADGWQTVTTSTASPAYVNICPAGYYGHFNVGSATTMIYSANGLTWNNATVSGFLTIPAA